MPTYVVLVNWTEEGIKNVKETIERTDEGTELADQAVDPFGLARTADRADVGQVAQPVEAAAAQVEHCVPGMSCDVSTRH
jgi:uncharacterized protein with GYD domain